VGKGGVIESYLQYTKDGVTTRSAPCNYLRAAGCYIESEVKGSTRMDSGTLEERRRLDEKECLPPNYVE
jgi:hypothetical protein